MDCANASGVTIGSERALDLESERSGRSLPFKFQIKVSRIL